MKPVALAAAIEVGTGLFLIVRPSALIWLLLEADLPEAGQALGRIAGIALLSLGWACWPRKEANSHRIAAPLPLLMYNALIAIYLAYLGISGVRGILLWPAVAIHAVLSIILIRGALFKPIG